MEIAQLLESALANNRSGLKKAAMNTVSKMPLATTVKELLQSEAADAIRGLTIAELSVALSGGELAAGADLGGSAAGSEVHDDEPKSSPRPSRRKIVVENREGAAGGPGDDDQSNQERIYRDILDLLADGPMTIGKLGKAIDVDTAELRGYLSWMKQMGKVRSSGKARATRYQLV